MRTIRVNFYEMNLSIDSVHLKSCENISDTISSDTTSLKPEEYSSHRVRRSVVYQARMVAASAMAANGIRRVDGCLRARIGSLGGRTPQTRAILLGCTHHTEIEATDGPKDVDAGEILGVGILFEQRRIHHGLFAGTGTVERTVG